MTDAVRAIREEITNMRSLPMLGATSERDHSYQAGRLAGLIWALDRIDPPCAAPAPRVEPRRYGRHKSEDPPKPTPRARSRGCKKGGICIWHFIAGGITCSKCGDAPDPSST